MTEPCTGPGRTGPCKHVTKYTFVGAGRREGRCGWHAYQWLGGSMPEWVEQVLLKGQPTAWSREKVA